jgi:hypothetical protein
MSTGEHKDRMVARRKEQLSRVPGRFTPAKQPDDNGYAEPNRHDRRVVATVTKHNNRLLRRMKEAIARKLNCSVEEVEANYGQPT